MEQELCKSLLGDELCFHALLGNMEEDCTESDHATMRRCPTRAG